MRINTPVTDREYTLNDGDSLVSKTDLKGHITYANAAFVEASGFSVEEVIGQPHNIVRHPDMPPEAFADLWLTLKRGLPWTGLVKNRRKNGDFYWVVANVTPVREAGAISGFLSVRTKPSRQQIAEASSLYARMRCGEARGVALKEGFLVRTGPVGFATRLLRLEMSLATRLTLLLGSGSASLAAAAGGAIFMPGQHLAEGLLAAYGVVTLGWFGWNLQATVIQPLVKAAEAARVLASGDLAYTIEPGANDDVGRVLRSLLQTQVNLRAVVGDICSNANSFREATSQIASGNVDLSGRTVAQAASLEQTSASMEEFTSTLKQTSEHTTEANGFALSALGVARQGGEDFERLSATMREIAASSKRISDVTKLIDGIAFQTNILALNAAVEAARAGDAGAGFAVVADEVRNLAGRASLASQEIRVLIESCEKKIGEGGELVAGTGRTMEQIIASVEKVSGLIESIAVSSREQSEGLIQVNEAVGSIDQTTQQNAALVDQASHTTVALDRQAEELIKTVSIFNLGSRSATSSGPGGNLRPSSNEKQIPLSSRRISPDRTLSSEKASLRAGLPRTARRQTAWSGMDE